MNSRQELITAFLALLLISNVPLFGIALTCGVEIPLAYFLGAGVTGLAAFLALLGRRKALTSLLSLLGTLRLGGKG